MSNKYESPLVPTTAVGGTRCEAPLDISTTNESSYDSSLVAEDIRSKFRATSTPTSRPSKLTLTTVHKLQQIGSTLPSTDN